jgi:CAAX protease family protein
LSSPENPAFAVPPPPIQPPETPALPPSPTGENPPWSGWDVLGIALVTFATVLFFIIVLTIVAQRLLYHGEQVLEVARLHPVVIVVAQVMAYLVVLIFMFLLVRHARNQPFWKAVRWNWPSNWWSYLLAGVLLSFGLQLFARLLPIPRNLPVDTFFRTPTEAWALAIFGITLAPLMEELFFRGFMYPVLARRIGIPASIFLTALGFGLIHASQLGRAWAPVLVIFLVGVALTAVRAATKSVAAGVLMHAAYNSTIFVLMFVYTDEFRHLEKLNQ